LPSGQEERKEVDKVKIKIKKVKEFLDENVCSCVRKALLKLPSEEKVAVSEVFYDYESGDHGYVIIRERGQVLLTRHAFEPDPWFESLLEPALNADPLAVHADPLVEDRFQYGEVFSEKKIPPRWTEAIEAAKEAARQCGFLKE